MPKLRSVRCACLAALCGFAICSASDFGGQTPSATASSADPKSLLLAAVAANGVPDRDAKPWHVKISFTLNDSHGTPESQGTFEEFWAAPDKYKRSYATTTFNQAEYATPAGIFRTGNRNTAPSELARIVDQFLHPFNVDQTSIDKAKLQATDVTLGTAKFSCVTVSLDATPEQDIPLNPAMRALRTKLLAPNRSTFCLSQSAPILRLTITEGGSSRIIRNGTARFADHVLPESVEQFSSDSSSSAGKQVYTAKLVSIEPLEFVRDTIFTPPSDAMPAPKVISMTEQLTRSQQVHHSYPQYDFETPANGYNVHTAGLVVVVLQVHTDGTVSPLRVSGPPALQQVSLDAVERWTYKPFQVNGEPVEVVTTATLVYSLRP